MKARAGMLVIAAALLAAATAIVVAAARGPSAPDTMEGRVRAVASTLRCPVCQDLSVADSPSALATEMRASIAQQLRAGRTPDEIQAEFVTAYGQWILLSPPRRGLTLVAWLVPIALALTGLLFAVASLRRWSRGRTTAAVQRATLTPDDRRLLDRALLGAPEDVE